MPRKKAKPRTRKKAISVRKKKPKKRTRTARSAYSGLDSFLDKTVTVRSLLKYSAIVLLFLLVVGSAFMLGRISRSAVGPDTVELSSYSTKEAEEAVEQEPEHPKIEKEAELEEPDQPVEYRVADEDEEKDLIQPQEQFFEAEPELVEESVELKVADFGFEYSNVEISIADIVKEGRGANWASVESLKLTVRNQEDHTIINPTRIKMKINPKGRGSNWWDDEVFLPDSFKNLKPGEQVSENIDVHVSFSDIYEEKDFQLVVLDDYDVPIAWYKKIMIIK